MFTREYLLDSDWYRQRLAAKQQRDIAMWKRHLGYVTSFLTNAGNRQDKFIGDVRLRRDLAAERLRNVSAPEYVQTLVGALGTDPTMVADTVEIG